MPRLQIGSLKSRLETEHNMGAATLQKLIFQGRVLSDDSTVEQLNFGEKDFIVFMLSRVRAVGTGRSPMLTLRERPPPPPLLPPRLRRPPPSWPLLPPPPRRPPPPPLLLLRRMQALASSRPLFINSDMLARPALPPYQPPPPPPT